MSHTPVNIENVSLKKPQSIVVAELNLRGGPRELEAGVGVQQEGKDGSAEWVGPLELLVAHCRQN
jgi:hypothetical protein